ncbi:hypothetical protein ACJQWK_03538 [Exserohilum turcicum]|uniref:Uncharacterized protein n=1 Tax=Exserohilum turcicum (strain 28A) TaxID=671987 RepID=R0KUF9_EXST2|nr:uncharacterized protein SETTUDRAFT_18126 [Exserohilum turcica Et28A]EOA91432.1 hypothetical protein SETTUDRAFT_18126 [Exserohilum turcica Et28A]
MRFHGLLLLSTLFAALSGVSATREVRGVPLRGSTQEKALTCLSFYKPLKKFWKMWEKREGPGGTRDFIWETLGCAPFMRPAVDWKYGEELFVSCARREFSLRNFHAQGRLNKKIIKLIQRQFKFDLSAQCYIDKHSKRKCRNLAREYRERAKEMDHMILLALGDAKRSTSSSSSSSEVGASTGSMAALAGATVRHQSQPQAEPQTANTTTTTTTTTALLPLLAAENQLLWNATSLHDTAWWNLTRLWLKQADAEDDDMPEDMVGLVERDMQALELEERAKFC